MRGLAAVLIAEEVLLRLPRLLGPAPAVLDQERLLGPEVGDLDRVGRVAQIFQVGDGVEAIGPARVAGDEDEVAFLGTRGIPAEVVLDLRRLAVFVGAEEADVEVVARIFEVVRVAAEEGDVELGGEDEPDVGVCFICVEGDIARPGRA